MDKLALSALIGDLNKNMLLASRLDLAYEIHKECEAILANSVDPLSVAERAQFSKAQADCFEFMKTVLNLKTLQEMNVAMQDRMVKKARDPEYIPGAQPTGVTNLPDPRLAKSRAQFNLRNLAVRAVALRREKIMRVNGDSRSKDVDHHTRFFNPVERDQFRVTVDNGQFIKMNGIKKEIFDTTGYHSHNKDGYAAFVINLNGEMSMFNHNNMQDSVAHSSMNNQRAVLGAGEIKIENGVLISLTDHSGHYQPDMVNFYQMLKYFKEKGIDISKAVVNFHCPISTLNRVSSPPDLADHYYSTYSAQELFEKVHAKEESKRIAQEKNNMAGRTVTTTDTLNKSIKSIVDLAINTAENSKEAGVEAAASTAYFDAVKKFDTVIADADKKASNLLSIGKQGKAVAAKYQTISKTAVAYQQEFMRLADKQITNLYANHSRFDFVNQIDQMPIPALMNAIKNIPKNGKKECCNIAAANGNLNFLAALKNVDQKLLKTTLDKTDKDGMTPLHHAATALETDKFLGLLALNAGNNVAVAAGHKDKKGLTPIHHLAINGDVETFEKLNAAYPGTPMLDILGMPDKNGMTVLHHAAKEGQLDILKFVSTDYGPLDKWMSPDEKGFYPVHHAAHAGKSQVIEFMESQGVKMDQVYTREGSKYSDYKAYDNGDTAAIIAMKNNNMPLAYTLLKNTHEITEVSRSNYNDLNTPENRAQFVDLFIADVQSKTQHLSGAARAAEVRRLTDHAIGAPDQQDGLGLLLQSTITKGFFSPVTKARGHQELDKITMTFLPDLELPKPGLHIAIEKLAVSSSKLQLAMAEIPPNKSKVKIAKQEVSDMLRSVIENIDQVKVNQRDGTGLTAAMLIAKMDAVLPAERTKIIEKLKDAGADFDMKDPSGKTPMHLAMENSISISSKVISALKTDANINAVDNSRCSPVVIAVQRGDVEKVKALDDLGVNLMRCDTYGNNLAHLAAHHAAHAGEAPALETLLFLKKEGVDIFKKNSFDVTPVSTLLNSAVAGNDTIEFLLKLKLNSNEKKSFANNMGLSGVDRDKLVHKVVDYFKQQVDNSGKSKNGMVIDMRGPTQKAMNKIYDNKVLGPMLEKNGVSKVALLKICVAEYLKHAQPQVRQVLVQQKQQAADAVTVFMNRRR